MKDLPLSDGGKNINVSLERESESTFDAIPLRSPPSLVFGVSSTEKC